jgi:hypothetical protein
MGLVAGAYLPKARPVATPRRRASSAVSAIVVAADTTSGCSPARCHIVPSDRSSRRARGARVSGSGCCL